jgi:hypothetical protein
LEGNLLEEINALLNEDGKMRQSVRDRLMLMCIAEIYRAVQSLPDIQRRVERLESRSILLFAEKHPRAAISLTALFFIVVNLWMLADVRRVILGLFGLPADLLP